MSHIEISRMKLLREPVMNYVGTWEQNYSSATVFPKPKQPMERSWYTPHFSGAACYVAGNLGSCKILPNSLGTSSSE